MEALCDGVACYLCLHVRLQAWLKWCLICIGGKSHKVVIQEQCCRGARNVRGCTLMCCILGVVWIKTLGF